jgi:tRNA(Arg) A34 adenosine deaminase TadA
MYELAAPPGELAHSILAHAEVNALARLDPEQSHETLTITTSLEPCPLCMGAVAMATVGMLDYLGADPYTGSGGRLQPSRHTERVPLRVNGPNAGPAGLLASAMHVAFFLERRPDGQVVAVHRRLAPDVLGAAYALIAAGAADAARDGQELGAVVADLLDAIT